MNYLKIHNDIIEYAQNRASSKKEANLILGYSERHHIIPKCMGGTNEKSNLVFLSAREHFIVHILLTKIYPNEGKLLFACHRLMYDKHGNKTNGKSYETLRKEITEYRKSQNKYNNQVLLERSNRMKGQTKETSQAVLQMSITLTGRTKENNEGIARMAEKRKGQTKQSHSGIASQAKKITGRTKETHSGVASQAKAMKGRTKENNEGMKQSANKRRGRTKETCPGVASMANKLRGRTIIKKPKLPEEIINEIYKKHLLGIKQVDIFRWVIELGYSISQRTIGNMIHKTKQSLKSDNQ